MRVTLIDQGNQHLFQPLLYQVATTVLAPSEIAWPLWQVFRDRKDVTTLLATVIGIDPLEKRVLFDDSTHTEYDTLVLATGLRHSYFGHREWEQFAPGMKTLADATTIRRGILWAFETAERPDDPAVQRAHLAFAVVGAGPTGVELAGIIAELAQPILSREFRRIDTRTARILLIEAGPKVLPSFPLRLSDCAASALSRLGVEVVLVRPVTACSSDAIEVGDDVIACKTIIWAAGVRASPVAEWLGIDRDRAGRAVVLPDLTVPQHPDIVVIGDAVAVEDANGMPVPGIAPAAKQMGAHAGQVIRHKLRVAGPSRPFVYRHAGSLATLGRAAAIADFGRIQLKGALAWWTWGVAHFFFLIGTRSRVAIAWSWLWSFFTGQNTARIITRQAAIGSWCEADVRERAKNIKELVLWAITTTTASPLSNTTLTTQRARNVVTRHQIAKSTILMATQEASSTLTVNSLSSRWEA